MANIAFSIGEMLGYGMPLSMIVRDLLLTSPAENIVKALQELGFAAKLMPSCIYFDTESLPEEARKQKEQTLPNSDFPGYIHL